MRALLIHGTYGGPQSDWFPWLIEQLEENRWNVVAPQFPTPDQSPELWESTLKGTLVHEKHDHRPFDLVVSHSIGTAAHLRFVEAGLIRAQKSVFASTIIEPFRHRLLAELCDPFVENKEWDWDAIRRGVGESHILHGSNDRCAGTDQAQTLSNALGGKLQIIAGGEHLNAKAGYDSFPMLWGIIQQNHNAALDDTLNAVP